MVSEFKMLVCSEFGNRYSTRRDATFVPYVPKVGKGLTIVNVKCKINIIIIVVTVDDVTRQ